jgi:HK97 family phage portal protein
MARFTWPWSSNRERFSGSWSISDSQAFAAWLRGEDSDPSGETVNANTIMGLAAVIRAVGVISGTVAGLPLKSYERRGDERHRVDSVFDDPYPGDDGMTQFEWIETIVMHLAIWRKAFLWNLERDPETGDVSVYQPVLPSAILKVERVDGRKVFTYRDLNNSEQTAGTEMFTHIPGPSLDGVDGHPMLTSARAVFSAALSGDKSAQTTLRRGIRIAGLLTPEEGEENDFDATEGAQILEQLRARVVGRENAGDVALINRRVKLQPWTPSNIDMQWAETRDYWLGEAGRLFGVPPHLLNDTSKQTSWGAGVAEQTLNFARFTLRHYTDRIQARLTQKLPAGQFCEFDYAGLLEGTPAQEIALLLEQTGGKPILTVDEARRIRNLPPLTPDQRAEIDPPAPAIPAGGPIA